MPGSLLILVLAGLFTYGLVLGIHALRGRLSLAPFYALLGGLVVIMWCAHAAGLRLVLGDLVFPYSSTVCFTGLMLGLFVVYVFDGVRAARTAVLAVCGLSALVFAAGAVLPEPLPPDRQLLAGAVPTPPLRSVVSSIASLAADFVLLSLLWEWHRQRGRHQRLWLAVSTTLLAVLWTDTLLFITGAFAGDAGFVGRLKAGLLERGITAFLVTPVLVAYMRFEQRRSSQDEVDRPLLAALRSSATVERELTAARREMARRQAAEEVSRASQQRLALLIASSPLGVIEWDLDFRITEWNEAAADIFGWPREQVLGRHASFLIPEQVSEQIYRVWDALLQGRGGTRSRNLNVRADGRLITCEWHNAAIRNQAGETSGVVSMVADVTERESVENDLRQSEAILRAVAAAAADLLQARSWQQSLPAVLQELGPAAGADRCGVYKLRTVDGGGEALELVHAWSSSRAPSTGGSRAPLSDVPAVHRWLQVLGQGGELRSRVTELPPQERAPLEARGTQSVLAVPVMLGDALWGFVLCEDCSAPHRWSASEVRALRAAADILGSSVERQEEEEAWRRIEERLQDAARMESLEVLAGGIAHDFNNLLLGIMGSADLAANGLEEGSAARSHVDQIQVTAQQAAELTRQILAYSGRGRFLVQQIDLGELIREMSPLMRVSTGTRAELRLELAPDLPPVEADTTQVRQVLLNLVLNASEAVPEGGTVTLRTGVRILDGDEPDLVAVTEVPSPGRYIFVEVSDDGVGMDAETRRRVFEPFYSTKGTGRGLGLAATLGIVRGHRGYITMASSPGIGTTFQLGLPAAGGRTAPRPPKEPAALAQAPSGTALVVDDMPAVRSVCGQILQHLGMEVLQAGGGARALDLVSGDPDAITVVFLDLSMPGMAGEEVLRELHRLRPDLPVVLMSGYEARVGTRSLQGGGPVTFLQKPFRSEQVKEALARVLART